MEFRIVEYGESGEGSRYLDQFLVVRKEEFIVRKQWGNLSEYEDREFDVYDVGAKYALLTEFGRVLAGARILRTDQKRATGFGARPYSYMLLDAFEGCLPGMPKEICWERPPVSREVWEVTRIVSLPERRLGVILFEKICDYFVSVGATLAVFIGPPAFIPLLRRSDFDAVPLGPVIGEGRDAYQAMVCDVARGAASQKWISDGIVDVKLDELIEKADRKGVSLDQVVSEFASAPESIFSDVGDSPSKLPR